MSLALAGLNATCYLLPGDGPEAERDFLALLRTPAPTYLADYGFTEAELVAEIEAADDAGIAVHAILDRTQAAGHAEHPLLVAMVTRLKHGDVTLSTAGPDSRSPSQLMHSKVLVTLAEDGGPPWCWVGSVNFGHAGFLQSNVAFLFRSQAFADAFVAWFDRTAQWARLHVPQLAPPLAVAVVVPVATEGASS